MYAVYWDQTKQDQILREITPYILEQCYILQVAVPVRYTLWWPWLKAYGGEMSLGYCNAPDFITYIWLDQELKKKMTSGG
jgi:peptide/nickel transport system substrate-binding protein